MGYRAAIILLAGASAVEGLRSLRPHGAGLWKGQGLGLGLGLGAGAGPGLAGRALEAGAPRSGAAGVRRSVAAEGVSQPEYQTPWKIPGLLRPLQQAGMFAFVALAAGFMPLLVAPFLLLEKLRVISRERRESLCLKAIGNWCAFISPLAFNVKVVGIENLPTDADGPLVWSCNHISNADFFSVLSAAPKLCRRRKRWPKVIYWMSLEKNPLFKLFGRACGMIPVAMEDTGSGNENVYDASSFRRMYTAGIGVMDRGEDLAILPEGQLNPRPWEGLQRVYGGPHSFSKRKGAKIQFVGLWGTEHVWKAGKAYPTPEAREIRIGVWRPQAYDTAEDFEADFKAKVGHFGLTGRMP